jgi:hypothetical protein
VTFNLGPLAMVVSSLRRDWNEDERGAVAFPGELTYLRASETRESSSTQVCDIVCEVWRNLCRICSLKSGATPE